MIVSRYVQHNNGKWYMEVDGKPYFYNSIQTWYPPDRDFETCMVRAKEIGYDIITMWIYWKELEPDEGLFDFSFIDEIIEYAEKHNIRVDFVWGGTNFCDHLDPRFAPDWVISRTSWLAKNDNGSLKLVNGFDMGECYAIDTTNEEIFQAEKNALLRLINHLKESDLCHRVIGIQLENEFNINGYSTPKHEVLSYINRLAGEMNSWDYRIAVRVNIAMWQSDKMDPDIDELDNIYAQGIDTYEPRVSYVRNILKDKNATKFRYVAENGPYENIASHIVATIKSGAFHNIYRLDYDSVWERPGAYGKEWEILPVTLRIKRINTALNKVKRLLTLAAPEDMLEFNTEQDGMPDMYYCSSQHLYGNDITYMTRGICAIGLVVYSDGYYYLLSDGDSIFQFCTMPQSHELGYLDDNGKWICDKEGDIQADHQGYNLTLPACGCMRIHF